MWKYDDPLPEYDIKNGIMVFCKVCDKYLKLLSGKEINPLISDERKRLGNKNDYGISWTKWFWYGHDMNATWWTATCSKWTRYLSRESCREKLQSNKKTVWVQFGYTSVETT